MVKPEALVYSSLVWKRVESRFPGEVREFCLAVKYQALSIVKPAATRIAQGYKTLEVRSWLPTLEPDDGSL